MHGSFRITRPDGLKPGDSASALTGWALIEMIIATVLAAVAASVAAAVFHAVAGGLARTTTAAARHAAVAIAVERLTGEMEAVVTDVQAAERGGIALACTHDRDKVAGTAELWFMAGLGTRSADGFPEVAQVCYRVLPGNAKLEQRLVRQEWHVLSNGSLPPPDRAPAIEEILLMPVDAFTVEFIVGRKRTGEWPPPALDSDVSRSMIARVRISVPGYAGVSTSLSGAAARETVFSFPVADSN